jgi:hypothetical protein
MFSDVLWYDCVGVGGFIMAYTWPVRWCVAGMLEWVIDYIVELPIPPVDKKQMLMSWCRCANVEITAEMVERVTELPAGTF